MKYLVSTYRASKIFVKFGRVRPHILMRRPPSVQNITSCKKEKITNVYSDVVCDTLECRALEGVDIIILSVSYTFRQYSTPIVFASSE